ncbi:M41 family metallopeptidase [Phocaeicola oris]|uniref:hypothetical protein n=1 Tax=Phocaeicola oris TaxID=2896850 RepID=UPI00234F03C2|nr:hypothetical protein [Phocaeicola oris]MCE2616082.1 hypothetical protein [Phocaeicola oris]
MDTALIILKAQFDALRNLLMSILPTMFEHDKQKDDKVWFAKYCLWKFERDNLASFEISDTLPTPEKDRISRRRHQLQVLMDVAYIQGRLEEHEIIRKVDSYAAAQAQQVYAQSDHSEETMLPLIDAL